MLEEGFLVRVYIVAIRIWTLPYGAVLATEFSGPRSLVLLFALPCSVACVRTGWRRWIIRELVVSVVLGTV
jgi:hypothetical protein